MFWEMSCGMGLVVFWYAERKTTAEQKTFFTKVVCRCLWKGKRRHFERVSLVSARVWWLGCEFLQRTNEARLAGGDFPFYLIVNSNLS